MGPGMDYLIGKQYVLEFEAGFYFIHNPKKNPRE
jgi:hypothetical protein